MFVNGDREIRVFVIAPAIMRWALQELIKSNPRLVLAGSAGSLDEAVQPMIESNADVGLADVDEIAQSSGLSNFLARTQGRLLVLTGMPELQAFDNAVLAGLQGIVRKSDSPEVLVTAIDKVYRGELWLDRVAAGRIFMTVARMRAADRNDPEQAKIALLTRRERAAIAELVTDTAAPVKVIASRLCMSEHTLRNHLTSIYSKLHLTNRLDLYAYATRHNLNGREKSSR